MSSDPGAKSNVGAVTFILLAGVAFAYMTIAVLQGGNFPDLAPQLVTMAGMVATVAGIVWPAFATLLSNASSAESDTPGLSRVPGRVFAIVGPLLAALGVVLDGKLQWWGLGLGVALGAIVVPLITVAVIAIAPALVGRPQASFRARLSARVARLKGAWTGPESLNMRRATAVVSAMIPTVVAAWALLKTLTTIELAKDTLYIGIWGVVAGTAAIIWLLTPLLSKTFSAYERHFVIGGILITLLGLALALDALVFDDRFQWWHLALAIGAGLLFALMFILSFGLMSTWRRGRTGLVIARWAVARLSDDETETLLQEMSVAPGAS